MQKVKEIPEWWSVTIMYSGEGYPEYDDRIRKLLHKDHDGGGMGFGQRDLGYSFKTKKGALNLYKRAKQKVSRLKYFDGIIMYNPEGDPVDV